MSIKVAQNEFTREMKDLSPLQKLPKTLGNLGLIIVATDFEKMPKVH